MAKKIQYIKTNKTINVNEVKTIKRTLHIKLNEIIHYYYLKGADFNE